VSDRNYILYYLGVNTNDPSLTVNNLKNLVIKAEKKGFDSFWVADHLHQTPILGSEDEPMFEGWTTLSFLAGLTTDIRLGTLVTSILYRNPSLLAKIAATFDTLSKGRLFLGVGVSYFEGESFAYGFRYPPDRERLLRLEEAIQLIRTMWTRKPTATFDGEYYQIHNTYCNPKPIQKPSPPILVGGSGKEKLSESLQSMLMHVTCLDLFLRSKRKLNSLKEHCKSVGRDYETILKTKLDLVVIDGDEERAESRAKKFYKGIPEHLIKNKEFRIFGTPDSVLEQIRMFEEIGIQYLIILLEPSTELSELELFAEKIIKKF
jgi:alkanesulfonate monooxygenase SsuD/methylene tetrahydromethanopterin reductase-like flavin-dependent oxidoreductase (luciferase family)